MERSRTDERLSNIVISGSVCPFSHFETAVAETFNVLWSTFFVTFMAKFFMQHIVPQMEYGIHCMNVGEHGCI